MYTITQQIRLRIHITIPLSRYQIPFQIQLRMRPAKLFILDFGISHSLIAHLRGRDIVWEICSNHGGLDRKRPDGKFIKDGITQVSQWNICAEYKIPLREQLEMRIMAQ